MIEDWDILNEGLTPNKPGKAFLQTTVGGFKFYHSEWHNGKNDLLVWCNNDDTLSKDWHPKSFPHAEEIVERHIKRLTRKKIKTKDFIYGRVYKRLEKAVDYLNANLKTDFGRPFDYPDYWGMPKSISWKLTSDEVDWLQEVTGAWAFNHIQT